MFKAIEKGDLSALQDLIDAGAEPDQRDAPLDEAEAKELRRAFHLLGELATAGRPLARTPLMHACGRGHVDAARILLVAGADAGLRDALGEGRADDDPRAAVVAALQPPLDVRVVVDG